jgi:hypothetical protein
MAALVIRGIDCTGICWVIPSRIIIIWRLWPFKRNERLLVCSYNKMFSQTTILKRDKDRESKNKSKFDTEIWDSLVNTNVTVFFYVTTYNPVDKHQNYGRSCHLHFYVRSNSTLKMVIVGSNEMLISTYQSAVRYISEDLNIIYNKMFRAIARTGSE